MTVYSDFIERCSLKNAQQKTSNSELEKDKWIKLRRKVINLYGTTCMKCGVKCTTFSKCKTSKQRLIALHVDHIIPRSINKDLEFDISNLQILCASCNVEKMTGFSDYRKQSHFDKLSDFLNKIKNK